MTPKPKKPSPLRAAIIEMATDMHASGIMDDATFLKITMRDEAGRMAASAIGPLTGDRETGEAVLRDDIMWIGVQL